MKKLFLCLSLLALTVASTFAGESEKAVVIDKVPVEPGCDCFGPGFRGGFFISGYLPSNTDLPAQDGRQSYADDALGGGVSLDYFFTDMLGLSGSAAWYGTDSTIHNYSVDAILRFPIEEYCIAPYALAGIGVHTNSHTEAIGRFGAGLEWACPDFNCTTLFADWIYTAENGAIDDYSIVRVGLKFAF
jgi:hypothetical protein